MKLPFFQLFPADYLRDTRVLSLEAKGGWMDIMCYLHEVKPRGVATLPLAGWARVMGAEIEMAGAIIDEIEQFGIGNVRRSTDGPITIVCRRMEREFADKTSNAERQRRFREKGGGDPDRWTAIRVEILKRDNYLCAYCGRKARTVDHIKPRCQGGDEAKSNLVAACYRCNGSKNGRTPEEAGMTFWQGFNKSVLDSDAESNGKVTPQNPDTRIQIPDSISKPAEGAAAPGGALAGGGAVLLEYPCAGRESTWPLRQDFVDELAKLYPALDVMAECRLAHAKIGNGAVSKKTARGMAKFLFSWMDRASNSRRGSGRDSGQRSMFSGAF